MNGDGTSVSQLVVAVAGASSGIGKHTALGYARRRAHLVLFSRNARKLTEVAERCREEGAREVLVLPCDIGDSNGVDAVFREAATRFGRIDIAAQCAAVTAFGRFGEIPADVFDKIVATNLLGAANVARCALAQFDTQGFGQLVLVGSLLGTTAVPYQSAYVASKFGVSGLVRALRQENRNKSGIKIHGIYPGPVDTPVYRDAANYLGLEPRVPLGALPANSVATAIVRATDSRRSRDRHVGVVNRPAISVYRLLPAFFDAAITPLLRLTAFRAQRGAPTSGNVFDSR